MVLSLKQKLLIPALILSMAIIAFISLSLVMNQFAAAEEAKDANIASIEEASALAGYEVAAPDFVPISFEKRETIHVMQLQIISGEQKPKAVGQEWRSEDGSWFALVQAPSLDLPLNGEDIKIGDSLGRRVLIPADTKHGRPPLLAYYWQEGTIGYSLCGSITSTLDEGTLLAIANSVKIK